jgi:potassium-dependent mechanosensitive channel
MEIPPMRIAALRYLVPLLIFVLAVFHPAHAQLSSLKKVMDGSQPKEQAMPEKPEDVRKRLELWQQQAREALVRFENPSLPLPAGIAQAELDDRRRDLEQMILLTNSSLKNLNDILEARKVAEAARAEEAAWTGFKEPPPYSILILDELLNESDATKAELVSQEASRVNFERLLAATMDGIKAAEESVSILAVEVQNIGPEKSDAAKWRLEAARARSRLLAARAGYMQANCDALKERIAASRSDLSLIARKVSVVAPNARFGEEELARISKIVRDRRKSLETELAAISKRLKSAFSERSKAQAALDALPAAPVEAKDAAGLELAKSRLAAAEARIESLQSVTESLESLMQLESLNLRAYQNRHTVMNGVVAAERDKAIAALRSLTESLGAWLNVVENESAACGAELGRIESRAATITAEDAGFPLINEQRAACGEKLTVLQRVRQAVEAQRKLLRRWLEEFEPKPGDDDFFQKVSNFASSAWEIAKKVWAFEVTAFDNSYTTADGVVMPGKIPVKLGMLLRALLFFAIGYFIASRVANHVQRRFVRSGHMMDAQARTLRNWAMIFIGFFLILGTLKFLHIPLTVFAFFGGALAIGIGFGLQTLIKNFISGIIVLVERKVRVGDILDVDGIVGTVVEVNTRSSIIRSADDVETMIPNSLFLENRVSNWTLSSSRMRRNVRVGAAYGSNTRTVMDILTEVADRHGKVCKDPAPFAVFEDFGDNALIFVLYFWVELGPHTNPIIVTSDLRMMIEKRFTESGIGVPFPQRDMHLTTDNPIQVQVTHDR